VRFYLVGEGPSDLCDKTSGKEGFLSNALVQLLNLDGDASLCDFVGVPHAQLEANSNRVARAPRNILLRGNKRATGKLAEVARMAEALAHIVKNNTDDEDAGAVFFMDCDFTNSEVNNPDRYHLQVIASVESGFEAVDGFKRGVAMIPKMRSESWLLCKYQEDPYRPTDEFEKLPANDESPRCAKKVLAGILSSTVDKMYADIIYADEIDWTKISCPSFNFFKRRFRYVACCLAHISPSCIEPATLVTYGAIL